jgi:NADP-dependent 3-hydroxy acid dehydrogenase YdfG
MTVNNDKSNPWGSVAVITGAASDIGKTTTELGGKVNNLNN